MDDRIEELIESDAELTKRVKAMTSIKGVGTTTAYTILAYLPELETLSRGQLISLAGLAPFDRESGKTKKKAFILNSAVGRHIEMLSAVFGGAFACIFFNCGAVRLSHARTL